MYKNYFQEKPGDDTGMQTRVWGPAGWLFLHSIAQNFPWKPSVQQQSDYYNFFKLTGNVLPCRYCRESYQKFITEGKTKLTLDTMKSRESVFTWLYNIHKRVNKKLGITDPITKKQVWDKYESFRSKCHKTPEAKVKKGCVDPMRGYRKKCVIDVINVDERGNRIGKVKAKPNGNNPGNNPGSSEADILNAMGVLNVTDRKDIAEIRSKYRRLAFVYHPDRPTGNADRFREINDAYELLLKLNGTRFGKVKAKGKKKVVKLISIKRSTKKGKKLMATFDTNGRRKVIHFGAAGMSDYTKHHDKNRRGRYIKRHTKDYRTGDPSRAGYLSMFVLWNKPSLQASISDYRRRLGVYNRTGKFPTKL